MAAFLRNGADVIKGFEAARLLARGDELRITGGKAETLGNLLRVGNGDDAAVARLVVLVVKVELGDRLVFAGFPQGEGRGVEEIPAHTEFLDLDLLLDDVELDRRGVVPAGVHRGGVRSDSEIVVHIAVALLEHGQGHFEREFGRAVQNAVHGDALGRVVAVVVDAV